MDPTEEAFVAQMREASIAAAVSDWLRSVTCAERGQYPALRSRRTGLRLRVNLRASRAPASSPFYPEECHRFSGVSPLTWTAGCARILFGIQLAGLYFVRAVPSNGPGRHWASGSTTGLIIHAPNNVNG